MSATMNYYELLGIDKAARPDAIKAAYKRMAMVWHPDRNKSANANEMFMKVREAYGILMNKESRALYDAGFDESTDSTFATEETLEKVGEILVRMYREGRTKTEMLKVCSRYGMSAGESIEYVNLVCKKVDEYNHKPKAEKVEKSGGALYRIAKFFAYALGGILGVILAIFATIFGWVAYKVLKPIVRLAITVVSLPIGIFAWACSIALVLDFILLALDLMGKYASPGYFVWVRSVFYFAVVLPAQLFGVDLRAGAESFFFPGWGA